MHVFYYFILSSSYSKDDFSDKSENYLLLGFLIDILLHFYSQHPSQCLTFLASVNLMKTLQKKKRLCNHTQKCLNIYMLNRICYSVQMLCFPYTVYPLPVTVQRICLFDHLKIVNVTSILERYIGRVGEGLLCACISSFNNVPLQ